MVLRQLRSIPLVKQHIFQVLANAASSLKTNELSVLLFPCQGAEQNLQSCHVTAILSILNFPAIGCFSPILSPSWFETIVLYSRVEHFRSWLLFSTDFPVKAVIALFTLSLGPSAIGISLSRYLHSFGLYFLCGLIQNCLLSLKWYNGLKHFAENLPRFC